MPNRLDYANFRNWLERNSTSEIHFSFRDIENIIGATLPPSARRHSAWWSNSDSHPLAAEWLEAGYRQVDLDIEKEKLTLRKVASITSAHRASQQEVLNVAGYQFRYLQDLTPEKDQEGRIIEYFPETSYENPYHLPLNKCGQGPFCRFSTEAGHLSGVYLWVYDQQIIYIGETRDLARRFNSGYGHISGRACYLGGQSTNCKMNKIVLDYARQAKIIKLFFLATDIHRQIEFELLQKISTPLNQKDIKNEPLTELGR